jgi:putative peptidoglycan lipid II flippase
LILLRQPIVALLMEYGRFTPEATQMVAWALLWFAAGLTGHCVLEILARAFYAMQDTKTPVVVGALAMGLNIALSLLFSSWFERIGRMPHGGLALANSTATFLEAGALILLARRRLKGLQEGDVLRGLAAAILGALGMTAALWGWQKWTGVRSPAMLAFGGAALGGTIYLGVILSLRVREIRGLLTAILGKIIPSRQEKKP